MFNCSLLFSELLLLLLLFTTGGGGGKLAPLKRLDPVPGVGRCGPPLLGLLLGGGGGGGPAEAPGLLNTEDLLELEGGVGG